MRAKNGKLQSRTTNSWNSPRGKGKKILEKLGNRRYVKWEILVGPQS